MTDLQHINQKVRPTVLHNIKMVAIMQLFDAKHADASELERDDFRGMCRRLQGDLDYYAITLAWDNMHILFNDMLTELRVEEDDMPKIMDAFIDLHAERDEYARRLAAAKTEKACRQVDDFLRYLIAGVITCKRSRSARA